jgi:hypothetical protein
VSCSSGETNKTATEDSTENRSRDSSMLIAAQKLNLEAIDFHCLAVGRDTVENWKTGSGKIHFIYYWPGANEPFTLIAYKRHPRFDPDRDTLRSLKSCSLVADPEGRYILGNLNIDKSDLRRLHNYLPVGEYEYLIFTPVIISDQPNHVVYKIDRYPEPDALLNKKPLYTPAYTNPTPPREP